MASTDKTAMGAFVIGGLVLFGLGLFLIGDRRMLFSKSADYYTEFAQVNALEAGAKVRVGGMDAGEVVEVQVPPGPGSKFRLKFRIIEKLFPVFVVLVVVLLLILFVLRRKSRIEEEILGKPQKPWLIPV